MRSTIAATAILLIASFCHPAIAQNIIKDYVRNSPAKYQPSDPWVRGRVYLAHTGHDGCFYNCDHEEDKRFSPYIYWRCQPEHCRPRFPILTDITQQLCEVKQRIAWGSCRDCVPEYGYAPVYDEQPMPVEIAPQPAEQPIELDYYSDDHSRQTIERDSVATLLLDASAVAKRLGRTERKAALPDPQRAHRGTVMAQVKPSFPAASSFQEALAPVIEYVPSRPSALLPASNSGASPQLSSRRSTHMLMDVLQQRSLPRDATAHATETSRASIRR